MRYQNRMDLTIILDRIDRCRRAISENSPPTDRAISLAAGLSADTIRNWRRAVKDGRTSAGAAVHSVKRLAQYLNVPEAWLLGEGDPEEPNSSDPLMTYLAMLDDSERDQLRDYAAFLISRRKSEAE